MNPAPSRLHQEIEKLLLIWLETNWARPGGNRVYHQINVSMPGRWPTDFRIPDVVLLKPERFHVDRDEYFAGPPNVVIEIRNPDDETYDKLSFYAALGVDEVWIINRDSRSIEIHALNDHTYQQQRPAEDGWLRSHVTDIELCTTDAAQLEIRRAADPDTHDLIPRETGTPS